MPEVYGQSRGFMVLLHGGAGPRDPDRDQLAGATSALTAIVEELGSRYRAGSPAGDLVEFAVQSMERNPIFNAGLGSALQQDGVARMSAAWMDSLTGCFSGVISIEDLEYPVSAARLLLDQESRVMTAPGIYDLADQHGLTRRDPRTPRRVQQWEKKLAARDSVIDGHDTVGCVLRTDEGHLFAATSTGGRGFELPGRVSDSATVAGTYCSRHAAIGVTGIGEEIVDDAVAARIETRVADGMSLESASRKMMNEAQSRNRHYGWIGLSVTAWGAAWTTGAMSHVVADENGIVASS